MKTYFLFVGGVAFEYQGYIFYIVARKKKLYAFYYFKIVEDSK